MVPTASSPPIRSTTLSGWIRCNSTWSPLPGGRLQALGIAWDTRPAGEGGQRWFHLYPGQRIGPGDPLHWTGRDQNWNYQCAECHSTDLVKGYDAENDQYDTTWAELEVSCEACHGPGSGHVEWARSDPGSEYPGDSIKGLALALGSPGRWHIDPETGLARRDPALGSHGQVETCGRCHARRGVLAENYLHGEPLLNTHRVALLEEGLYFADGQMDDEVYVYGSFLQSRMYREGVTCSDCHDPHSLSLRAEGNDLCGTCHLGTRFDTREHHFHEPGSEAAQCVACHMPARTYMVVDPRRDHSFRVPRPDLAREIGAPDACTACHTDRSPGWAADAVESWYGVGQRPPHYAEALHAGRGGAADAPGALARLAADGGQPAIARATAVSMMGNYLSPVTAPTVNAALRDPEPMLRLAALNAIQGVPPKERALIAEHLLDDPVRGVRIETARVLADAEGFLSGEALSRYQTSLEEYVASQELNADRAESHANLGNLWLRMGRPQDAEAAYRAAIDLDPDFVPGYVNLADLYRARGDDGAGEALLAQALEREPEASAVHHARGLLLVRVQRLDDALVSLAKAVELAPGDVRYRYVYAVALDSAGRTAEALEALEMAHRSRPADRDVLYALVSFHQREGNRERAIAFAEKLLAVSPWDRNARALWQSLQ